MIVPYIGSSRGVSRMGGKWLLVLPLLVGFSTVLLQPVTREARHLDQRDCCPCPDSAKTDPSGRSRDALTADFPSSCLRQSLPGDAEPAASILLPALRAIQPFVKQPDEKSEPKPLLQPEVGLASSVLETLRQATDEEYHEARARDAARSAVKLLESTLDPLQETLMDPPKNTVRIFLNSPRDADDMDDNLPEPSHIQETRCIHSPLTRTLKLSRPTPIIELIEVPSQPRRLRNKSVLHRKFHDMDNGISASNINERIMQSNPGQNFERVLKASPGLSLFPNTNLERAEDRRGLKKNIGDESNRSENTKPKLNLKLRELIDNLEKARVPLIDLNKYISPTTRTPSLKLSPLDKPYDSRPLLLKDILKLKDVELIPQKTKSIIAEKPSYPSLKLQSGSFNVDIDNCQELNSNHVALMNDDNEVFNPIGSDILDTDSSPTNSNPVFDLKSNEIDIQQNFEAVESMASSENSGVISLSTDIEDQVNFDYGEVKFEQDSRKGQLLSDHCNVATDNSFMQPALEDENKNRELNEKRPIGELEDTEDKVNDELNNGAFPIMYVEDFDMPIEVDNNSFMSNPKKNENILNDPIADTSNNVLQINKQDFESPTDQETRKEVVVDCNSQENFSKISNSISEDLSDIDQSLLEKVPPKDNFNSDNGANDFISDKNRNPNDISFRDLQDMSDSILSLSECEPPQEETNNNLNENLNQINDDYDVSDIQTSGFDANSKETETDSVPNIESLNTSSELNDVSNVDSIEKLCKTTTFDETSPDIKQSDIKQPMLFNPDIENSEMRAEASAPELMNYEHRNPLFKNTVEADKQSNIFTKDIPNKNDIPKFDKNSIFLNNLKSTLTDMFTTPEKVNDNLNNADCASDDNMNESSNNNPLVALPRFDIFKNLDNLQRTPQTLLSKIALPELPTMPLHSFKNMLASTNDALGLLNFPKSFDDSLDPSPAFDAISDKLRSHTENTIKNVKETFESTLKHPQSLRLSPTDTIDIHDVIGSISERHDEMKDKLEAINLDLNDRFSSFHQSILDHFKVLPGEGTELQKKSNIGKLKASSMRQEMPITAASQLRNVKEEPNLSPRLKVPRKGKTTEIKIMSQKPPAVSDEPRFRNADKKLQKSMFSTTTSIPSFVTRPKVLKTNFGVTPRIPSRALSKTRPTETISPEEKVTKFKPLSLKSQRTNDLSEKGTQPRPSSKINLPLKSFESNTENIDKDNSIDSPMDKLRKAFFNKNINEKFKNELKKTLELGKSKAKRPGTEKESFSGRMQDGRARERARHNEGPIASATSQKESGLQMVEPLRENVPYKCKLMCYKD